MPAHTPHDHTSGTERGIERMEAFSDGVFAIAITLLAVDIRLPRPPDTSESIDLTWALLWLWPSYLAYIFSFVVIGIYWVNHHDAGKLYVRTDHAFNLLNLLFLMSIAFLPFPTRVLAEFITDPANRDAAARFYAFALVLPSAGWLLKWLYGSRGYRIIDPHLDPAYVRRMTTQYVATFLLYLAAVLLTWLDYRIGLGLSVGLTLFYLLPPSRPVYVDDTGGQAAGLSDAAAGRAVVDPLS